MKVAELVHSEDAHLFEKDYKAAGLKTTIKDNWFYVIGDKPTIEKIAKAQGLIEVVYLSDYGIKTKFPELKIN